MFLLSCVFWCMMLDVCLVLVLVPVAVLMVLVVGECCRKHQ